MSRRALWITAALLAAVAALLTAWLAGPRNAAGTRHGSRTGRPAPAASDATPFSHPRVAALAPGIAQTLRDLGCGSLLVARHSSDLWSDQSLSVCGDQQSIDYERLIAANPTHVLLQWGERELPERLTTLAKERGWVVKSYPLLSLDDVNHASIAISGSVVTDELNALHAEDRALKPPAQPSPEQIIREQLLMAASLELAERTTRAYESDASLAGAGRVLLLYQGTGETGGSGHPAALGPGSYSHDILIRIGGRSATPTGKAFMPLDAEDVAALTPDTIVIVRPRDANTPQLPPPAPDELLRSLGPVARLDIPAVKTKHIALIDDPMALIPGTNLTAFADSLRAILKGWSDSNAPAAH